VEVRVSEVLEALECPEAPEVLEVTEAEAEPGWAAAALEWEVLAVYILLPSPDPVKLKRRVREYCDG
jgi:hypothetical protein